MNTSKSILNYFCLRPILLFADRPLIGFHSSDTWVSSPMYFCESLAVLAFLIYEHIIAQRLDYSISREYNMSRFHCAESTKERRKMNKSLVLNTFLENNSLSLLLEAVSVQLGCPVIVTDNAFHVVSAFAAESYSDSEYRRAISHSELPLSACAAINAGLESSSSGRFTTEAKGRRFSVGVLQCSGASLGYIIYILSGDGELSENDCLFCESLVAKQFYSDRHTNTFSLDTAEEILFDLLDGKFKNEEIFKMKAGGTFLAHFEPSRFALLSLSVDAGDRLKNEHIAHSLEESFHASHPIIYGGTLILFLHEDHDESLLRSFIREYELKAVLSEKLNGLFSLKREFDFSKSVLDYLQKEKAPFLTPCREYKLLMFLKKARRDFPLSDEKIEKIYEYDKENDGELCLTLFTYLCCRHSLQETADRLFTHRNTVQYRIRKLREDFEIETDEAGNHLALLLSLSSALIRLGNEKIFLLKESEE